MNIHFLFISDDYRTFPKRRWEEHNLSCLAGEWDEHLQMETTTEEEAAGCPPGSPLHEWREAGGAWCCSVSVVCLSAGYRPCLVCSLPQAHLHSVKPAELISSQPYPRCIPTASRLVGQVKNSHSAITLTVSCFLSLSLSHAFLLPLALFLSLSLSIRPGFSGTHADCRVDAIVVLFARYNR